MASVLRNLKRPPMSRVIALFALAGLLLQAQRASVPSGAFVFSLVLAAWFGLAAVAALSGPWPRSNLAALLTRISSFVVVPLLLVDAGRGLVGTEAFTVGPVLAGVFGATVGIAFNFHSARGGDDVAVGESS